MKKILFSTLFFSIYCLASNFLPIEEANEWTTIKRPTRQEQWIGPISSKDGKSGEWITYCNRRHRWFTWVAPQRGTVFNPADFGISYPFWIKKIKHMFYEREDLPWATDEFTLRIYGNDTSTVLYEKKGLIANKHPMITEIDLGRDSVRINSGTFTVAIVITDASEKPSPHSLIDSVPAAPGRSIHGEPGNWVAREPYMEYQTYAYVSWAPLARDVTVYDITHPPTGVWKDSTYSVECWVRNRGKETVTFNVSCIIRDRNGNIVYGDTQNVANLAQNATRRVRFDSWKPLLYDDEFRVKFTCLLLEDQFNLNDTLTHIVYSYEKGEIAYDDFTPEAWYIYNRPNPPNAAFAVRFTPYLPTPFYVMKVKIFVGADVPFEYVGLYPGTETAPNLNSPYFVKNNVAAPGGWLWFRPPDSIRAKVTTPGELWVVAKFMPNDTGPGIGCDTTQPVVGARSYISGDMINWLSNLDGGINGDWMIRIVHLPTYGIEEEEPQEEPQFVVKYPTNPLKNEGFISYTLNNRMNIKISLYDITGRLVYVIDEGIKNAGTYEAKIDCKKLLSGIYFCKFEGDKIRSTNKLIIIR